jgi:diguanylate cyclase (GGDEF)-like protein
MNNTALLYCCLVFFIAGMVFFTVACFSFSYCKVRRIEASFTIVISSLAFIYLLGDASLAFYTMQFPVGDRAMFFLLLREYVPLASFIVIPGYLERFLKLSGRMKTLNRFFLVAGILGAAGVIAGSLLEMDLFLKHDAASSLFHRGVLHLVMGFGLAVYFIYSIIIILLSKIREKSSFLVWGVLSVAGIAAFAAVYRLYHTIFFGYDLVFIPGGFPVFALLASALILILALAVVNHYITGNQQIQVLQSDINSALYFDPEVDLPNMMSFRKNLQLQLDNNASGGVPFSLLFFDVDDFQNLNESYGEAVGDEVLRALSRRMVDTFSSVGDIYRIGGDDFVFILEHAISREAADKISSMIISSIRNPFVVSGASFALTVSAAILMIPQDGNDLETIMGNAYRAVRSAKKKKNCYVHFDIGLLEGAANKINMVNLLRSCISKDEFVLFYQPVVDDEGRLIYAEALLRCTNPDPRIGGPGDFIPLIEKAGMMKNLDNLVVRKAFYDMEMKIGNRFGLTINLSAGQLSDPSYGQYLSLFAKQHGIEPNWVVLEITESTLVENIDRARENMIRLKENGFLIAIDDFGKGFSSLTYLVELPIDILKIDMAFVQAVPGDERKEKIAKYIMDLGRALGLRVLAEGFELPEQVEFFRNYGCALFEGYYFSRPLPLADLLEKYPS